MDEPDEKPRRYKWPWFVAVAVALGVLLAVVWMRMAAKTIERERDWNGPLTGSGSK